LFIIEVKAPGEVLDEQSRMDTHSHRCEWLRDGRSTRSQGRLQGCPGGLAWPGNRCRGVGCKSTPNCKSYCCGQARWHQAATW
jgi:hypothetical protein